MIVGLFFSLAAGFWAFWSFRTIDWTFPRFLMLLVPPALMQFMASTIVPSSPDNIESGQEFYYAIR